MLNIVRENTTELELKSRNPFIVRIFILFWACGFAGIPLFALLTIVPEIGATRLTCQRIEPTQVECIQSKSRYLGASSTIIKSIKPTLQAQFNTQEILETDGDRMVRSWLSLRTDSGETKIIEDLYNKVSGDDSRAKQIEAIASQVQTFLNSQSPKITLVLEDNWQQGIQFSLFLSIFPLLAALVLYLSFRSHTVILDKMSDHYTHKIHTLLGTRIKTHRLDEIQRIEVRERTNDGSKYAILAIKLRSGMAYKLIIPLCHPMTR
jgi:hypothetical protein